MPGLEAYTRTEPYSTASEWVVVDDRHPDTGHLAAMTDAEAQAVTVSSVRAAVTALYHLRAHFFESHGIEYASQKDEIIASRVPGVVAKADALLGRIPANSPTDKLEKALVLFLKGRALNVKQEYDAHAEEALSKSIKFDPGRPEAWNALGECLWKKKEIEGARDCFQCAVDHRVNKESLRNLSMVYRQLPVSAAEVLRNVESSVEKGKEAVAMDVTDGISWMVLGNAYLSLFFMGSQDAKLLTKALAAYKNAARDPAAHQDSHFRYNRAVIYNYKGMYNEALAELNQAAQLEPGWQEPVTMATSVTAHLQYICGKLRIAADAATKFDQPKASSMKLKGKNILVISAKESTAAERKMGCCHVTVISGPSDTDTVALSAVVVDADKHVYLLTMYNMPPDVSIQTGTKITVLCPQVSEQVLKENEYAEALQVCTIRVDQPSFLWIDGEQIGQSAQTVLKIVAQSE